MLQFGNKLSGYTCNGVRNDSEVEKDGECFLRKVCRAEAGQPKADACWGLSPACSNRSASSERANPVCTLGPALYIHKTDYCGHQGSRL